MAAPGTPANLAPATEATLMRTLEDQARQLRELGPSIAESFAPVILELQGAVADIAAAQADLAAQQAAILDLIATQTTSAHDVNTIYGMGFSSASEYVVSLAPITVPAGYTKAIIITDGGGAIHPAAITAVGTRARVDLSDGSWWQGSRYDALVQAGAYQSSPATTSYSTSVTPGMTITVSARVTVGVNVAADPYNWVGIGATVLFSRS